MRIYLLLFLVSLLTLACEKVNLNSDEGFTECDESGLHFFEPTNKTFIPPTKGSFIDTLCVPLILEEDRSYIDLTSSKVCLLEQNLGLMLDKLNSELCEATYTKEDLDLYYYQYVGVRMGQQEYIFVNAFKSNSLDSVGWKREPFIGNCNDGISQWSVLFNLDDFSFEQYQSQLTWEVFYTPEFPYNNLSCARCISIKELETFRLSSQELCLVKTHFDKLQEITSVGGEGCFNEGKMVNFNRDWLFQYMGVQKNGLRWIYINAVLNFATGEEDKKQRQGFYSEFIPPVCDGGTSHFGVFFDLGNNEFMDLQFNGF